MGDTDCYFLEICQMLKKINPSNFLTYNLFLKYSEALLLLQFSSDFRKIIRTMVAVVLLFLRVHKVLNDL